MTYATGPGAFLIPLGMAAAAGLMGSIAVMRRMALASDALSHIALPGIAIALLVHVNPFLGGLIALVLGTVLVWAIEYRSRIPTDVVVGVIFSAALAMGSLLASGDELIEALFGAPNTSDSFNLIGLGAASLVIVFIVRYRSQLVIRLVSPDLARPAGINVPRLDLLYLLAFALTIALGLRYLGVLLMGSLIIIPAATAMRLGTNLRTMQTISVAIAMLATLSGTLLAPVLRLAAGPLIIVIAASIFFLSLAVRRA